MTIHRRPEATIVHSSDLHVGIDDSFAPERGFASLNVLERVLGAAAEVRADVVILAGDTFDNHRQPAELLERAGAILRAYRRPVVILPGNHDPLTPDSVYRRAGLDAIDNVSILGLSVDGSVTFPALELEIWGRPHLDYGDMAPLAHPRPRTTVWQLATAHGHYVNEKDPNRLMGSWLIYDDQIAATGADYLALGHWNRSMRVGDGRIIAHYSGSPEYTGTVNVVRLMADGTVRVATAPLR
ncbi:MAG TPA: DNA repair exonuclease [Candidatus Eisenbacteria bacterium]|nr:DNA repair exonuclease [Candidatus Eisenbacteria bacterium]